MSTTDIESERETTDDATDLRLVRIGVEALRAAIAGLKLEETAKGVAQQMMLADYTDEIGQQIVYMTNGQRAAVLEALDQTLHLLDLAAAADCGDENVGESDE